MDAALSDMLEPSGLTWKQFKEAGGLASELSWEKYRERGFSTPSRKYEFAPQRIAEMGREPLPGYLEPPESPVSKPEMTKDYPLILITGIRQPVFFHSESRQIDSLRRIWPEPLLEVHPETAAKYNLKDGGMALIESPRGGVSMKVKVTPGIMPDVVAAPHCWWFPEKGGPDYGWRDANINVLTDSGPPYDSCSGAVSMRTLLCRVRPAG
jgi:anaerobic selenocysteine-containing dehydrogenase